MSDPVRAALEPLKNDIIEAGEADAGWERLALAMWPDAYGDGGQPDEPPSDAGLARMAEAWAQLRRLEDAVRAHRACKPRAAPQRSGPDCICDAIGLACGFVEVRCTAVHESRVAQRTVAD